MKDVLSVMQNYIKAYKDNDKQCFESLWDRNAIFEDPVGSDPMNGIDAISAFWDFGHSGFSIIPRDESFIVCGDEGILEAVMQVRSIEDGSGMDIKIIDHFKVTNENKIAHLRAFWDQSSITTA
jgi:steroid delta-isomerase